MATERHKNGGDPAILKDRKGGQGSTARAKSGPGTSRSDKGAKEPSSRSPAGAPADPAAGNGVPVPAAAPEAPPPAADVPTVDDAALIEDLPEAEEVGLGTLPDEELMKLCQDGDMAAFDVLYDRHAGPAMSFIHRMISDFSRTEALNQEAFLRIFKEAGNYEYPRAFSTWFYTIVRNLCKNELRYRSRHPTVSIEETVSGDSGSGGEDALRIGDYLKSKTSEPLENMLSEEMEKRLRRALDSLPEIEREILILHRFQGLKYREISEVVGIPVGTVRSRIHTALDRLRKAIRDLL